MIAGKRRRKFVKLSDWKVIEQKRERERESRRKGNRERERKGNRAKERENKFQGTSESQ